MRASLATRKVKQTTSDYIKHTASGISASSISDNSRCVYTALEQAFLKYKQVVLAHRVSKMQEETAILDKEITVINIEEE